MDNIMENHSFDSIFEQEVEIGGQCYVESVTPADMGYDRETWDSMTALEKSEGVQEYFTDLQHISTRG